MSHEIGTTAGDVWRVLDAKGQATVAQIQKEIGVSAALTNQAIGWLTREGKIKIDRSGRYPVFSLRT